MDPIQIEFTHVVNPHLFWYKHKNYLDAKSANIEDAITNYVKEKGDQIRANNTNGNYRLDRSVAVYLGNLKKWVRAEIDVADDELTGANELIVWATDYGIPVKTTLDLVAVLSPDLKRRCIETSSAVFKGGIYGIMPAEYRMSTSKNLHAFEQDKWDQQAVDILDSIREKGGMSISFKKIFEISNHVFGELIIERNEIEANFGEIITGNKTHFATKTSSAKFERDICGKSTIKINRWLNNDGKKKWIKNSRPSQEDISEPSVSSSDDASNTSDPQIIEPPVEINQRQVKLKLARSLQSSSVTSKPKSEEKHQEKYQTTMKAASSVPSQISSKKSSIIENLLKKLQQHEQKQKETRKPVEPSSSISHKDGPAKRVEFMDLKDLNEFPLVNKVKLVKILVKNNEEEPIEAIKAANFTDKVHQGMKKMNMQETYISQAYAWPNLMRGNSMVLVDSQNKGKTIAYLPALCSLVQKTYEAAEKSKSRSKMGASAIIVTTNVPQIADMCRKLLQLPVIVCNVVEAIGTRDAVNVTVKLYNGCNILVVTAPCLVKLIKETPCVIKNDKLMCVAFENMDRHMEKHKAEIDYIVSELCLRIKYKADQRQIIVTSRTWHNSLLKFMNEKMIADSVLLIGNYLEAAIFAGVTLNFNLCQSEVKCANLAEYVQSIPYEKERTLVVCNEAGEAEQVANYFEKKKIPYELVKEIDSEYAKARVKSSWENKKSVLICTDTHLMNIFMDNVTQIRSAQHILHFSLPTQDFRKFLMRFSAMMDFYNEHDSKPGSLNGPRATSTMYIDNENMRQLPKLVDLLTRDGQPIPKELCEISQTALKLKIKEKAEKLRFEPICNMLFMHGTTEHRAQCKYRHLLLPSDIMEEGSMQPTSGYLRFIIIKCISPTEYIVQPTYHATGHGEEYRRTNRSDEFESFNKQMQIHYKVESNRKALSSLELGQKCVILVREKYYRAEITCIIEKRQISDVDRYNVRLIDTGETEKLHAFDLYSLDEQFQALPNQAFHLHLTGVIPADKEDDWDERVCKQIQKHLHDFAKKEKDLLYEANIVFSLRNTFVVDIMRLINTRGIVMCSIKKFLDNKSHGLLSNDSRKKVFEMAHAQGIKIAKQQKITRQESPKSNTKAETAASPKLERVDENKSESPVTKSSARNENNESNTISWEDSTSEDSTTKEETKAKWACPWKWQHKTVKITQFYNINNFFVTQDSEQIRELYRAIDDYVAENIKSSLDDSMRQPDVYKYCLVETDDGYCRAKVLEVEYESEIRLKVFLLDTGLSKKVEIGKVYDIPDDLIQRFPFQAIWCNMIGVKVIENEDDRQWVEDRLDQIYYNVIDEYGNDLVLHTVSTDRSIKFKIPDTNIVRHDVVLLAVRDNKQININTMLIEIDLAEYDLDTKDKLDNVPNVLDEYDDSDSDWDNCENINNKWKLTDEKSKEIALKETDPDSSCKWLEEIPPDEFESFMMDLMYPGRNNNEIPEQNQNGAPEIKRTIEPIPETSEINADGNAHDGTSTEARTEDSVQSSDDYEEDPNDRALLEYVYKRPQTTWWQDEESIVLKFSAHDNVKYGLKVTSDSLIYATNHNEEQFVAVVNFFGFIDTEKTSHEIRGLNVVVRLRKQCPIMWPHLLLSPKKCTWLSENVDAAKDDPLYEQVMDEFGNVSRYVDSDDEEEENIPTHPFEFEEDSYDNSSDGF